MTSDWDFSDLRSVYVNCTLKRSPEVSHTQGLADVSITSIGASCAWTANACTTSSPRRRASTTG
jgi:hypothetical protein